MNSLFEYGDYKKFLTDVESRRKISERGFRSRISELLGCQNAYVSQVLNTNTHFSLEHALKISNFLKHNPSESKYFLTLVEIARAGTQELKDFFKEDLERMRSQALNLKERVPKAKNLDQEIQNIYYSSWHYPAVQILLTIPQFRNLKKIAEGLRITEEATKKILSFLLEAGLAIEQNGAFFSGLANIHLNNDSPHIRQHLTNWRIAAVSSLQTQTQQDLHYSTVSSLSAGAAQEVQLKLGRLIQDYVELVVPSRPEHLFNLNIDFYSVLRDQK